MKNTTQGIQVYDTTLRDGLQRRDISCLLEDKLKITRLLVQMGIPFIEGGWPGANPLDTQYFKSIQKEDLGQAQVVAFCSTHRSDKRPETDSAIKALLDAETLWAAVFGKTWDLHVIEALKVDLDKNLAMIQDTIRYLVANKRHVIYDAEHWFDGYKANPDYAFQTLSAAFTAGAEWLVLCDTNGGTLPDEIATIVADVRLWLQQQFSNGCVPRLGIHTHDDSGTAVAGAMAAVDAGVEMVQGTINGYGERCGNANLCTLIPNLQLKKGYQCISSSQLSMLAEAHRFVSETFNLAPDNYAPYVGRSAFAHKGGVHVSAVERNPQTYEHIPPSLVGNNRQIVVSNVSGASTVRAKARDYGIDLPGDKILAIVKEVKELESKGYQFEAAEASFKLLMLSKHNDHQPKFQLKDHRVNYDVLPREDIWHTRIQATVRVSVGNQEFLEVAEGIGPISAFDKALRRALVQPFPAIKTFQLTDYKVRILNSEVGTAANIRVLVESSNDHEWWSTIGVSKNLLEASYEAVTAGIEYGLRLPNSVHLTDLE